MPCKGGTITEKTVNTRIKLKRDTSANWTSKNPVLLNGEMILVDTADGEVRKKIGDGKKTYTQLPFCDEAIKSYVDNRIPASSSTDSGKHLEVDSNGKAAWMNAPTAPWKFAYDSYGDVLSLERSVTGYTKSKTITPYNIAGTVDISNVSNAYSNTDNTAYAQIATSTTANKITLYIDTGIPSDASITSLAISFKTAATSISTSVFSTRQYSVKCGGNTLRSGSFSLSTTGRITTVTVTDMAKIVSPIIVIELTIAATAGHYLKLFGAQVEIGYSSSRERVSIIRQGNLAVGDHYHSDYATKDMLGFDP